MLQENPAELPLKPSPRERWPKEPTFRVYCTMCWSCTQQNHTQLLSNFQTISIRQHLLVKARNLRHAFLRVDIPRPMSSHILYCCFSFARHHIDTQVRNGEITWSQMFSNVQPQTQSSKYSVSLTTVFICLAFQAMTREEYNKGRVELCVSLETEYWGGERGNLVPFCQLLSVVVPGQ